MGVTLPPHPKPDIVLLLQFQHHDKASLLSGKLHTILRVRMPRVVICITC